MPTRFTPSEPCPICGGNDHDPRGEERRCWGFLTDDRQYVHCMRPEYAGALLPHAKTQAYVHKNGACLCGKSHAWSGAPPATTLVAARAAPIVHEYEYRDEHGAVLFAIARFANGSRAAHKPGQQKGTWSIKGTRRVLYRLPELLAADPGRRVFVTEGEKDAERLAGLGFVATSPPFGAHAKWKDHPDYSKVLKGRHIVVCPDNDEAGHRHAQEVATCLWGIAAEVRLLTFEGVKEKGDVSDWLDMGHSKEELETLVRTTPPWRAHEPLQQALSNGHNVALEAEVIAQVAHDAASKHPRIKTTAEFLAETDEGTETMLVDGLVPAAQAGLLAGDGRTGKTLLALQLARARARGEQFLGHETIPGPSLLCLCDDARSLTKQRMRQMFTAEDQIFWFIDRYDPEAYAEIADVVATEKPRLVVIDTLAMIIPNVSNAENDPATMKMVMEPYTKWANDGITVIFLHHVNAQGGIRGCTGIKDNVHFVMKLENMGLDTNGTSRLVKVEMDWKYPFLAPFVLTHDDTGFTRTEKPPTMEQTAQQQILALLGQGKMSISMLVHAVKEHSYTMSEATIRRDITTMVNDGRAIDLGPDPTYTGTGRPPHLYGRAAPPSPP